MKNDTESILEHMAQHQRASRAADGPQTTAQDADEEGTHPSQAYGFTRGQNARAETIEFRFLNPAQPDVAAEYSFRRRTIWHKKNGSIELVFVDGLKVTIAGINLVALKEEIRLRRVTWVQEQGTEQLKIQAAKQFAQLEGKPFVWVERITLEENEDKTPS